MIFFLPTHLLGPTQLLGRSGYYQSEYQDLGSPHICKTLKVTSKHSSFQGKYQLSDVVMNGKPSWKWKEKHKGWFHLHLLVFPFVYQFNSRIGVLVICKWLVQKDFNNISASFHRAIFRIFPLRVLTLADSNKRFKNCGC